MKFSFNIFRIKTIFLFLLYEAVSTSIARLWNGWYIAQHSRDLPPFFLHRILSYFHFVPPVSSSYNLPLLSLSICCVISSYWHDNTFLINFIQVKCSPGRGRVRPDWRHFNHTILYITFIIIYIISSYYNIIIITISLWAGQGKNCLGTQRMIIGVFGSFYWFCHPKQKLGRREGGREGGREGEGLILCLSLLSLSLIWQAWSATQAYKTSQLKHESFRPRPAHI